MDVKLPSGPAGPAGPAGLNAQPALRSADRASAVRAPDALRPGGPHSAPVRGRDRDDGQTAGTDARPAPFAGPDQVVRDSMGRVNLPPPLELMAALEAAQEFAPMADRAVPGLGRLVSAVIDDERFKLGRMLDLGR